MMILVAVTVTFTIGENGILSQAKESARLAERAQVHEQIMGQIELTNEGKIKIQETYDAVESMLTMQGYEVGDLQADGTFEVTGKKGTYKYKITETEITIEENTKEDDTSDEEIVWAYINVEEEVTELLFIGEGEELEIIEDKEVKAYVGRYNEDTDEREYNTEEIISVKFSEVVAIVWGENVKKVIVGPMAKNTYIGGPDGWDAVVLEEFGDIPEYYFNDLGLKNVIIEEGITTIGEYAFARNNLVSVTIPASVTTIGECAFADWNTSEENIIYYEGTQEQWKAIEMDINSVFGDEARNAKIVFADGTQEPLFQTEE